MGTKDYAQDGIASWQHWGELPTDVGLVTYINDGDDNSCFQLGKGGSDKAGSYEFKVQVNLRFINEIKFVTWFIGLLDWDLGFKLQYWDGSWQTLYTQPLTHGFDEAKTSRSYTNGGAGFENVTYIRLWVEWAIGTAPCSITSRCYSLILNSTYYPDSGFRFKTNDGLIGIGKDTAAGTNKLRFYDGTSVQGIPLLATNSRYATNIRIYDGAAIKSLAAVVD